MFARGCHSRRKIQKRVIFIVFIWRLQVYHVCINLLLQQQNANAGEFARLERRLRAEKREEYVIDLTIKPLNITITTNFEAMHGVKTA